MIAFTERQLKFLQDELGETISKNGECNITDEKLKEIFNLCCRIEEAESIKHQDDEMSERGAMAIKIVDLIYPLL